MSGKYSANSTTSSQSTFQTFQRQWLPEGRRGEAIFFPLYGKHSIGLKWGRCKMLVCILTRADRQIYDLITDPSLTPTCSPQSL